MNKAIDNTLATLERHGCKVTPDGDGWRTSCPSPMHAHGNRKNPALSISEGKNGAVLINCHAGCSADDIVGAIGIELRDLFPPKNYQPTRKPEKPSPVRTSPPAGVDGVSRFTYTDANGRPVIYVTRQEKEDGKQIRQHGPGPDGKGWIPSLKHAPKPRPLYRLPAILKGGGTLCIHEGEKPAVAACKASLHGIQTTSIGGAGNARHSDFTPLKGRDVCIIPDNDTPGEKHAQQVARLALEAGAKSVQIIHLPGLPEKGDVVEWLEAGGTPEQWAELIEQAPFFNPEPTRKIRQIRQNPDEWPEIVPLDKVEHPKPLDMRLMPQALVEIVGHVAEALQAPREMAWAVCVAVLATAIGKRAKIKLPTHVEPSPIWTCTILPPGSRKSGVFGALVSPLDEIEAERQELWHEDWLQWQAEKELAEANIAEIKKNLRKKSGDRRAMAMEMKEEKRVVEAEPVKPRLYLTDTTTEALRKALQDHGSIGLLSAEGSSVLEAFGRYNGGNKGADMALFLSAHAGDPDKGARVSGTHGVREALASIGITAQPDVLQSIGRDRMAKGRGLIDRLLFLMPPDPRGTRNYRKQIPLDDEVMKRWAGIVRAVFDVKTEPLACSIGGESIAIENPDGESEQLLIEVADDAAEEWIEFAQDIEDRQKPGADLHGMSGFASKLAGAVGRIALAYHFAQGRDAGQPIDKDTMLRAICIGMVLIEHAKAALMVMGEDDATVRARQVLDWLKRHGKESVKPSDVARAGAGGCKSADEARAACHKLAEHGYLVAEETEWSGTGRKPGELWKVNPELFSDLSDLSGGLENEKTGDAS